MNTKGFDRRLDRLVEKVNDYLPPPAEDVLASPEWPVFQTMLLEVVKPFPDAEAAIVRAFEEIEAGSRHDWKFIEDTIFREIWPYMDARVAIAEKIMAEVEKENNASQNFPT